MGLLPSDTFEKFKFLILLVLDPIIFSGFVAGFLASMAWMAAMTKFDLSHAYPFMSLNFVVVFILSGWILNEPMTHQKLLGVGLIVLGTIISARG
jgi:drug/metabolite transporter (DMT)-like permease